MGPMQGVLPKNPGFCKAVVSKRDRKKFQEREGEGGGGGVGGVFLFGRKGKARGLKGTQTELITSNHEELNTSIQHPVY